jgi:hypothetical protein
MVTTRQLNGSKDDIVKQIQRIDGHILSAILVVEEPSASQYVPPTDAEFAQMMEELASLTVSAPHADDSRDVIYTRMPGE